VKKELGLDSQRARRLASRIHMHSVKYAAKHVYTIQYYSISVASHSFFLYENRSVFYLFLRKPFPASRKRSHFGNNYSSTTWKKKEIERVASLL